MKSKIRDKVILVLIKVENVVFVTWTLSNDYFEKGKNSLIIIKIN